MHDSTKVDSKQRDVRTYPRSPWSTCGNAIRTHPAPTVDKMELAQSQQRCLASSHTLEVQEGQFCLGVFTAVLAYWKARFGSGDRQSERIHLL